MNAKLLEQIRYDLACEVLAMGKDAPVDLETVIEAESDRVGQWATEAAAILAFEGETAGEYAFRVQQWLRGLVEKHITDEQCKEYAESLDRDRAVEEEVERRMDEKEAA